MRMYFLPFVIGQRRLVSFGGLRTLTPALNIGRILCSKTAKNGIVMQIFPQRVPSLHFLWRQKSKYDRGHSLCQSPSASRSPSSTSRCRKHSSMAPVNKPKHQGKALVAGAAAGIFGTYSPRVGLCSDGKPPTLQQNLTITYPSPSPLVAVFVVAKQQRFAAL
jgi:hypothetical protein